MIDLYTFGTPNGRKASIMLEETGLEYVVHSIDIMKDEQFAPDFIDISPYNKIPAIVDHDNGMSLMESGAILLYLADKTGQFLSTNTKQRWQTIEWLMWQMGGLGPMAGQSHHFAQFNKGISDYAEKRYVDEVHRLYGVLDKQLKNREFIVEEYSIADIATWPWVSRYEWQQVDLKQFPHVQRWYQQIAKRPAVQKGYHIPAFISEVPPGD